jgi:hypothetical protein
MRQEACIQALLGVLDSAKFIPMHTIFGNGTDRVCPLLNYVKELRPDILSSKKLNSKFTMVLVQIAYLRLPIYKATLSDK